MSIEPQDAPVQPCPGTAVAIVQVTLVFETPVTFAMNWNGCDGARNT